MNHETLKNYDVILLIDKSGSMYDKDGTNKSRWERAHESTVALANAAQKWDADGISVILFAGSFKEYKNVTDGSLVDQIFKENDPSGSTDTAKALQYVFDQYFSARPNNKPILVLVVTDGEPTDRNAVKKAIINATQKMEKDEEIGIQFYQIGKDAGAASFLKELDDDLQSAGAKFDIVDTKNEEEAENMTFADLLLSALQD